MKVQELQRQNVELWKWREGGVTLAAGGPSKYVDSGVRFPKVEAAWDGIAFSVEIPDFIEDILFLSIARVLARSSSVGIMQNEAPKLIQKFPNFWQEKPTAVRRLAVPLSIRGTSAVYE